MTSIENEIRKPPAGSRVLIRVVSAAILAGIAAWAVGESRLVKVAPGADLAAEVRSATLVFGIFGALLGMAVGAAAGFGSGSLKRGIAASAIGLFAGGAAGGLAARTIVPIHERLGIQGLPEEIQSYVAHGGIWIPIGAATGLALGVGLGGVGRTVLAVFGGASGMILATMLYDILSAVAFPLDLAGRPISATSPSRLAARLIVAVLAPLFALAAGLGRIRRAAVEDVID